MTPSLAHLSPTLPAALATGAAVTLSVFLLAGAEPQGEPAPLLPALGGAGVHVIAKLPAAPRHDVSEPVATPVLRPAPVATSQPVAVRPRVAVTHAQRPKHHGRARVHRAAPLPAQIAPPAVPAPVVTRQTFRAPTPRGKARGHSHSRSHGGGRAAPAAARTLGHGNAPGHTHHGASPGHAKKAPAAPHPEHLAPPKAHGGGPPPDHGGGNGHGGKT
jgi:hypothetical protein